VVYYCSAVYTFVGSGYITGGNMTGGAFSVSGNAYEAYAGQLLVLNGEVERNTIDQFGTITTRDTGAINYGLFSVIQGQALPFLLLASNGDSASWDGTPTTFTFTAVFPAPESSSLLLLGTVTIGLGASARKRLSQRRRSDSTSRSNTQKSGP
jgi:hypothetical protein